MPAGRHAFYPQGPFRARVLLAMVRYRWFIRLRWLFVIAAALLLLSEQEYGARIPRPGALWACVAVLAGFNLLWWAVGQRLMRGFDPATDPDEKLLRRVAYFANAQMTLDLLLLTIMLRYSGGVENPMAVFYLFHVLIAALLLTPRNAALQGYWALLLYGGLAVGECLGWIDPHYPFLLSPTGMLPHHDVAYVTVGISVLGIAIFGSLYFTLQISSGLDEQESELQRAYDALRRSQAAIEELQARRSRFMQTAAHQLKSPIAGIETLAGLVRDGVIGPGKVQSVIERIIGRCQQATVQVTELLTLARVQGSAPEHHEQARTPVASVVDQVAQRFFDRAVSQKLHFTIDAVDCDQATLSIAARDLEDCLNNLLDNAFKYTPTGGRVPAVFTQADADHVRVTVADTGMGIAEDHPDDIFDPFRRGNLAIAAGIAGSGLGLAVVREVVERAGGKIDVRTEVGQGSDFTLTLPRAGRSGPAAPEEPVVRLIRGWSGSRRWGDAGPSVESSTTAGSGE